MKIEWLTDEYLPEGIRLKMEKAAELLDRGNISIPAISHLLGYSDPSSFYHAFTSYYKKTPRTFSERQASI